VVVFFTQALSGNFKLFIFTGTACFELATFGVVSGVQIQRPRITGAVTPFALIQYHLWLVMMPTANIKRPRVSKIGDK
jgi:hypothetical protein